MEGARVLAWNVKGLLEHKNSCQNSCGIIVSKISQLISKVATFTLKCDEQHINSIGKFVSAERAREFLGVPCPPVAASVI